MQADVLVVGAGPAGLAAAIELRRIGVGRVLVADREREPGGVPRHCAHSGYGVRDLRRLMTGPAYAWHYARAAADSGVEVRCRTTVTALGQESPDQSTRDQNSRDQGPDQGSPGQDAAPGALRAILTSPAGIHSVTASAVLLATGCRERPRPARLVPGDRPARVMTTGELQQRVYLAGERVAGRALIVGAEHVSFSALLTLSHAGARVIGLVTDQPRHQSFGLFRLAAALRWRTPVWTSMVVTRIIGKQTVSAVELRDQRTGQATRVDCETIVFTGDWIPDHELARLAGARMDPASRGPSVDTALRTSVPRLFAAGNLVHPAETADVAALGGRHAARAVAAALRGAGSPDARPGVPVLVAGPLAWITPAMVGVDLVPPHLGRFLVRGTDFRRTEIEVRQGGRLLGRDKIRLVPGRNSSLAGDWVPRVDPASGPVLVTVRP
jgi:thioredoxin reductase